MKRKYKCTKQKHVCDDSDNESSNDSCVSVVNNNVFFYCSVSRENVLKLHCALEKVQQDIFHENLEDKKLNEINLYIQSEGGDLFAGIGSMNYIENMQVHVNVIIDGFVASAASIIALGGHTIYMQKYATMLIHQLSTGFFGKYEEIMEDVDNTKKSMTILKSIYENKTKIPAKHLKEMLKKDIYLDSETCKQYKIVHEIC